MHVGCVGCRGSVDCRSVVEGCGSWWSLVVSCERNKLSEKRRWLLIEFCAPHNSTMSLLSQKAEDVTVLTVSEEDDGADPETLKLLKQVCALRMHVLAGKKLTVPLGWCLIFEPKQ